VDIRKLYPNIPDTHTFYSIICNPNISAAMNHLKIIKDDVRIMVGYKQRSAAVESYFKCIEECAELGNNVEKNWGDFYNEKQQAQVDVS
jgi:hypothetical protein